MNTQKGWMGYGLRPDGGMGSRKTVNHNYLPMRPKHYVSISPFAIVGGGFFFLFLGRYKDTI